MFSSSKFAQDTAGSVKIEFLVVIPLIFGWIITSFVFFDAYRTSSRSAKATYAVSDIMSRQTELDLSTVLRMHDILDGLIPWSFTEKSIRVTSLRFELLDPNSGGECYDDDGEATGDCGYVIRCSHASGGAQRLTADLLAADDDLRNSLPNIARNDSIVLTETVVPYDPLIDRLGLGNLSWSNRLAVRPRFVPELSVDEAACDAANNTA